MTAVVGALAAATVALLASPPAHGRRVRNPPVVPLLIFAAPPAAGLLLGTEHLPVVLVVVLAAVAVHRQVRRRHEHRTAEARAEAVLVLCDGLAADLRSGLPPVTALGLAAEEWPAIAPVADAARYGSDVPRALRDLAAEPGAGALRVLASAWVLAHRTGAGLADAVALAARTVREERATGRVVATELAAARATARMLALLPVGVLLLARGTGGDPFSFLLATPAGQVCLALGVGLLVLGSAWIDRIARGVLR